MLFKNLPTSSLFTTIPARLILDGVAALTFLNKEKGLQHVLAIAKAHFIFYFEIPKLMAKRQKIKQKNNLVGRMNFSVLVNSKLKGANKFSQL
jgi:PIN domain nuclease of toxin-antitoxin system